MFNFGFHFQSRLSQGYTNQGKIKMPLFSFPIGLKCLCSQVILVVIIFTSANLAESMQTSVNSTNLSHSLNGTTLVRSATPPVKTLFGSQLFQPETFGARVGNVIKNLAASIPLPVRESYIAYEHPVVDNSNEYNFDQYFKPSKFPPVGLDNQHYSTTPRLQNEYPTHFPHYQQYTQHHTAPLYFPLPPPPPPPPPFLRLVRIPGNLHVEVTQRPGANDLEVICDFPAYLLIVQQIYWHVIPPPSSPLQPYGIFYDSRNGFAPRVTVTSVSKWKSVLRVRDYSPDDYGTYRCVSTAILPDEPDSTYFHPLPPPPSTQPPASYLLQFPYESLELRTSASSVETSKEHKGNKKVNGNKRERKIKFTNDSGRSKREAGAFGVYAPFFKPIYGIYRVYREVQFYGDIYGAGSTQIENVIDVEPGQSVTGTGGKKKDGSGDDKPTKKSEREGRFNVRWSKVMF